MAQQLTLDPWALNPDGSVDPFTNVDLRSQRLDEIDPDLLEEHPLLVPNIVTNYPQPEPLEEEPVVPPPPPQEPDVPETLELEDGTLLSLEKDKGQWKGSVAGPTGSPQIYWGKTKNELVLNILKAQANATKKIREQNAKLKFSSTPAAPVLAPSQQATSKRRLTADEIFEYKTLLESDPEAAQDFLLLKTRGVTMDDVLSRAQRGSLAEAQIQTDLVCQDFLRKNPDYYPDREAKNFNRLVQWLSKFKLGKSDADMFELHTNGQWTVENIEEAFEDLSSDDLMVQAPRLPKQAPPQVETPPPVAVQPNEPALPAPRPNERIVQVVTRPRAAMGLRNTDVTPVAPPEAPKAPSAEELENMSDAQIKQLLGGVSREMSKARRSN